MASTEAQQRWRSRTRFTKKQLNVNARVEVHAALEDIAKAYSLRGKAEAVAFTCFMTQALLQQARNGNSESAQLLATLSEIYHQNREDYQP